MTYKELEDVIKDRFPHVTSIQYLDRMTGGVITQNLVPYPLIAQPRKFDTIDSFLDKLNQTISDDTYNWTIVFFIGEDNKPEQVEVGSTICFDWLAENKEVDVNRIQTFKLKQIWGGNTYTEFVRIYWKSLRRLMK